MNIKNKQPNFKIHLPLKMLEVLGIALLCCPLFGFSQNLTSSTNINITKSWYQQPNGYAYPINIFVPSVAVPQGGFPVCILLHGNGGNGAGMINQCDDILPCHILVAPTGYQNSWNICAENSDAPDTDMINDLVNNLQSYANVNPNKIRILGSSNGAGLANRVFIENNNQGIDKICAVVSHLNEPQFHAGKFYKPSGITNPGSAFCGYDSVATPLLTRKYLSISNENDNLIPYQGGLSVVGVSFLPAETAAYQIAVYKGDTGSQLTSGTTQGNPEITEFAYLSGDVVHIKGNAMHATNETQKNYIKNYFSDCAPVLSTQDQNQSTIEFYPNPTSNFVHVKLNVALVGSVYSVYDNLGVKIYTETIHAEDLRIELGHLPAGNYIIKFVNQAIKVAKR